MFGHLFYYVYNFHSCYIDLGDAAHVDGSCFVLFKVNIYLFIQCLLLSKY